MSKLERVVFGFVAAGIVLVSVRQGFEVGTLRAENAELRKDIGLRMAELVQLESSRPKVEERFNGACGDSEADRQRRGQLELLRLRAEVGLLRRAVAEQAASAESKARTERVDVGTGESGPRVQVSYDPEVWKPSEPEVPSQGVGLENQRSWELKSGDFVHVRVSTVNATNSEEEFRRDLLLGQKFRGDPAELVLEGRRIFGGRDWLMLEFHNKNTRPPRTEIQYFLTTPGGSVTVSVVATAEIFGNYRGAMERFLEGVQVRE